MLVMQLGSMPPELTKKSIDLFTSKALPHLREVGSQINTRLLEAERLSQTLVIQPSLVERVQQPVLAGKQRVPALPLCNPRVLALLQAVCHFTHPPNGFRHRDLRCARQKPRSTAQPWIFVDGASTGSVGLLERVFEIPREHREASLDINAAVDRDRLVERIPDQ